MPTHPRHRSMHTYDSTGITRPAHYYITYPPSSRPYPKTWLTISSQNHQFQNTRANPNWEYTPPLYPPHSPNHKHSSRKLYGDIVIHTWIAPLGCPFISCPMAYLQSLYDTFCTETMHYIPINGLTVDILLKRYSNHDINHHP